MMWNSSPIHFDFKHVRLTPAEVRKACEKFGWRRMVGFQSRNLLNRAQFEMTLQAMRLAKANLLVQPIVGPTKPDDIDYFTRARCFQAVAGHYPPNMMFMSLLPLAMRMAGPREALWHALIAKNYGCTHFIVGPGHASPGNDGNGNPFYEPYGAQALIGKHHEEIGLEVVPFEEMVWAEGKARFVPRSEAGKEEAVETLTGEKMRYLLELQKQGYIQ